MNLSKLVDIDKRFTPNLDILPQNWHLAKMNVKNLLLTIDFNEYKEHTEI